MNETQARVGIACILKELEDIVNKSEISATDAKILRTKGLTLSYLGEIIKDKDIVQAGKDAIDLGRAFSI